MSHHRFIVGHVLDALRSLPDESIHCAVTSPPYFALRDYGLQSIAWPEVEYAPMPGLPPVRVPAWEGQLGLEPTPEMYTAHLVLVFREMRRVLRDDATFWLNLGDCYAGSPGNGRGGERVTGGVPYRNGASKSGDGLKEKDLVGIPWRVAFALEADGWWLRSDIIWAKNNALPESVKDRPAKTHEYVFLLAKSRKYYYDQEAIKEDRTTHENRSDSIVRDREYGYNSKLAQLQERKQDQVGKPTYTGFNSRWKESPTSKKNKRTVWVINTVPYPEAHFAVFPPTLVEPCVLAGTSPKACPKCGAPWKRVVQKARIPRKAYLDRPKMQPGNNSKSSWLRIPGSRRHLIEPAQCIGWQPGCFCSENDGSGRCTVLDPFGGAGTTTLVAMSLNRDSVYIDLKQEYAEMALERCGFTGSRLFDQHSWEVIIC